MRGCLTVVRARGRDRPGPQAPRTTGEALNGGLLGAEVPSPMALRARCPRRAGISNDDTLAMAQAALRAKLRLS